MTALALQAYAVGLVGFSFVKVLAPAFFAREDTRTPVRIGIIALITNVVIGSTTAWYLTTRGFAGPHTGLAGATSIAAVLNAVLLYNGLRRADIIRHRPGWAALLLRVLFANVAMVAILWQMHRATSWWLEAGLADRITWLGASVVAGAGAYFLSLVITGMRPAQFRMGYD